MTDISNIPDDLRARSQWIAWRNECRECGKILSPHIKHCPDDGEKTTKRPYDPHKADSWAKSDDPSTWGTLEDAKTYYDDHDDIHGIGFMFSDEGTLAGVDLDDCRDPDTGELTEWAEDIIDRLDSYSEISPSGTGVHVYVYGLLPEGRRKRDVGDGEVEVYDNRRYFTVTGDVLRDGSVAERAGTLKAVHEDYVAEDTDEDPGDEIESVAQGTGGGNLNPQAENGHVDLETARGRDEKLDKLLNDLEPGYDLANDDNSASGYDYATVSKLCFWGFSKAQVADILRNYRYRGKLDRDDYLNLTINNAWHTERHDPNYTETDGGVAVASAGDGGDLPDVGTWGKVEELYNADEKGTTGEANSMAASLLNQSHSWAFVKESERFYHYNPEKGYYEPQGEIELGEIVREKLPGLMNKNRKQEIADELKDTNVVRDFSPPEGKVNVGNGVVNIDDAPHEGMGALEDHNPEYYFTSAITTDYDPDADSELWHNFLTETCHSDEQRKTLMEFVGYALEMWHHNREKNLFIVGPPQTGKSSFADTIQELIGEAPTVSNLTPQQVADTNFDAYALKPAVLNTVNDINATKIEDSGTFKRIMSGERMKMEPKYGHPHFAAPTAKHMFTANWLPHIVGQDEAVFRRMLISEFPNQIGDDAKDSTLKDRLKQPEVLSTILNEALEARHRLKEQGGFTQDRDRNETRRKWDSWQDPHKRFLYTQCEFDDDGSVEKDIYFHAYQEWAGRKGYNVKAKQGITKALQWVPEVTVTDDAYHGITIKDEDAADYQGRSEREYQDLTSIDPREKVLSALKLRLNDSETVSEQAIIEALATDMGEERVQHTIEKLCTNGTLIEKPPGQLSLND